MAAQLRALIPHARNTAPGFRAAATSYIQHGGEARYLTPIADYFGETPIDAITPFDIKQMAQVLFPIRLRLNPQPPGAHPRKGGDHPFL